MPNVDLLSTWKWKQSANAIYNNDKGIEMPSSININGVSISGRSISIGNGRITIDGQDHTPDAKIINIEVNGSIASLSVDACEKVQVNGPVGKLETMSGDVYCGDVEGDIKTMSGNVFASKVDGGVETMSGDINLGK